MLNEPSGQVNWLVRASEKTGFYLGSGRQDSNWQMLDSFLQVGVIISKASKLRKGKIHLEVHGQSRFFSLELRVYFGE